MCYLVLNASLPQLGASLDWLMGSYVGTVILFINVGRSNFLYYFGQQHSLVRGS